MKKRIFTKLLCLCLVLFLLPTVAFAAEQPSERPTVSGGQFTVYAYKKPAAHDRVNVTLDNNSAYAKEGNEWKVYKDEALAIGVSGVNVDFNAVDNVLTLSHTTEIPDGSYWVSFTESGKLESDSGLQIIVQMAQASVSPVITTFEPDKGTNFSEIMKTDNDCTFTGIRCDDTHLTEGVEYTVDADTVIFTNSYMKTLQGKTVIFTFEYEEMEKYPTAQVKVTNLTELPLTVGGNGTWRMGSTTGLAFTVTQELAEGEKILGVMLDDNGLLLQVPNDYTLAGSTVTLTPAYLTTLTEGRHTLKILIGGGEGGPEVMQSRAIELPPYTSYATATFTVLGTGSDDDDEDPEKYAPVPVLPNPDTGVAQMSNHFWWMLLGLSLLGATTVLITIRKKTDA